MKASKMLLVASILVFLGGCSQVKPVEAKKDSKVTDVSETVDRNSQDDDKVMKDEEAKEKESTTQSSISKNQSEDFKSSSKQKEVIVAKEPISNEVVKEEIPNEKNEVITSPPKQETPPVKEEVEEILEQPVKQTEMAQQVMNQINAYRQQHGLQPLESTSYYQEKADAHALDMATQRALWHADNGECITNHPDPFNASVSSPEHNEILLRENNAQGVVSIYYVDGYYYSVFRTAW